MTDPSPTPHYLPTVRQHATYLTVVHADHSADFHHIWLRHNCGCIPHCRHPKTLESIVDFPSLQQAAITPSQIRVTQSKSEQEEGSASSYSLQIEWADGHSSSLDLASLAAHAYSVHRASDLALLSPAEPSFPQLEWSTARPSDYLSSLLTYGCILVRGAPRTIEDTLPILQSRLSSALIETHFGLIEDLRPDNTTNANNDQLGYTNAAVDLHTDQPFLATPPSMQMLHCITEADSGGESSVSDGVGVALEMRRTQPRWFRLLCTVPVRFHRKQRAFEALFVGPMIVCDADGQPIQIRSSYFTLAPFSLNFDEMEDYYAAHRCFAALIRSPRFCLTTQLHTGDFLVYDNHRMLHARTAFTGTARHLRGVYVDRQQVIAHLSRQQGSDDEWETKYPSEQAVKP